MPTFAEYEEIDIDWLIEVTQEYRNGCMKGKHAFRPDYAGEFIGECEVCGLTPIQLEPRYRHATHTGIAWVLVAGCLEDGAQCRVAHMVGDDAIFHLDASDLSSIADEDYCSECGQIGCGHGN